MTPSTPLLCVDHLTVLRGSRRVLDGATLSVAGGEFVGLIGPNGAGKTTLMRAALGLIPAHGRSNLAAMPPARRARAAAWLPQGREVAWPVTVRTLVALGRLPHGGGGTVADHAAIDAALRETDTAHLQDRRMTELSGGEQARALIARALAQQAPLLLADEPGAGLDPAHQIAVMTRFAALAREGHGVVASLHDLGLAVRHCSRLIVMDRGAIVADGPAATVLSPELLARVFGVTAVQIDTDHGRVIQPVAVVPRN